MGKTITLASAPNTAEIYGKAVTGLLPVIGKPAKVCLLYTSPSPRD